MEDIKWIFSGVGVFLVSIIFGVVRFFLKKKKREMLKSKAQSTVKQYGDKSVYIEENKGDITIN
ncbi:MAG: hypothetical protein WC984_02045 [Bacteroidales bacterium]